MGVAILAIIGQIPKIYVSFHNTVFKYDCLAL